jgi:hypothetical protein
VVEGKRNASFDFLRRRNSHDVVMRVLAPGARRRNSAGIFQEQVALGARKIALGGNEAI